MRTGTSLLSRLAGADFLVAPPPAPSRGTAASPCDPSLTERERDILLMISLGLGNKTIARRMDISVRTVENHRASLRRKLGTGSVRWLEAMVAVILNSDSLRMAELLMIDMQTADARLATLRRMMN